MKDETESDEVLGTSLCSILSCAATSSNCPSPPCAQRSSPLHSHGTSLNVITFFSLHILETELLFSYQREQQKNMNTRSFLRPEDMWN